MQMINEHTSEQTCQIAVRTSRLAMAEILKAIRKHMAESNRNGPNNGKGKQSVSDLVSQGQGVTSIDIEKTDLKAFEKKINKYGVDFAVVKDRLSDPPMYTVFFKAKDRDAIDHVLKDFGEERMGLKDKPIKESVLAKIKELKKVVAEIPNKMPFRRRNLEL